MVRKRLITVLTINNGVLFRTRNFIPDYRYTINFVDSWSIDEVVLLDITRPGDGDRENFYSVVKHFAKNCFVPLTVGGGVRNITEVKKLLDIGADKVAINSQAAMTPDFIARTATLFGSQCVVVSIDVRMDHNGRYTVFTHFGEKPLDTGPVEWAKQVCDYGAGEILLQSIDLDGTLEGYDNRLNKSVAESINIPLLACSGAGNWKHFVDCFTTGDVSAVCTTNIYHFTESSVNSAKQYIKNAGIDIRV